MNTKETLSIIIPIFNEGATLQELLRRVESIHCPQWLEKEIILIDDGSSDSTKEILKSYLHYKVITHDENLGKGASVIDGLKESSGDYVVIQDADLEYDPNDYIKLLQPIKDGESDMVYGSRFLGGGRPEGMSLLNFVANKFLTMLSNLLTGLSLTDIETCYKMFSRKVVDDIKNNLVSMRFGIEPEITAKIKHHSIKEVPISYSGRSIDEGKKIGWKDGVESIYDMLRFNWNHSMTAFVVLVVVLILTFFILPPRFSSDSQNYYEAMQAILGNGSLDAIIHRFLQSPLAITLIAILGHLSSNILVSWYILNAIFFLIAGIMWYKILVHLTKDEKISLAGLVLFVTNYGIVAFGLAYLMDMGSWAAYLVATYAALLYLKRDSLKVLVIAALIVGLGGLYKEYAFLAGILLGLVLAYKHIFIERNWLKFVKRFTVLALSVVVPVLLTYAAIYVAFDYTYVERFASVSDRYGRPSLLEYVKVFGSLLTFGWILFLIGLGEIKRISKEVKIFLVFMFVSTLPLLVWPVATQRIQFLMLLPFIIIASLAFKNKRVPKSILVVLFILYVMAGYLMDSFILPNVNIDAFLF